jgi:hypothetical protein
MRYFFHSETDSRSTDIEGMDFASPDLARAEAIKLCAQMMHEAPRSFWGSRPWSITITDDTGLILWNIDVDATSSPAGRALD